MTELIDMTDRKKLFKEFVFCVQEMRKAQRAYFNAKKRMDFKSSGFLSEAVRWESKVDNILAAVDASKSVKLPLDI